MIMTPVSVVVVNLFFEIYIENKYVIYYINKP